MNKRIDLLDKMKKLINDPECRSFMDNICTYYEINDIETGAQHGKIFRALYLDKGNSSYDEIANRFYINVYTLDRYRQKYNNLARKLIAMDAMELSKTIMFLA